MKARMFTLVWGDQHLDWFNRAAVASLSLPRNLDALHNNVGVWDIVTRRQDEATARGIAEPLGLPIFIHHLDVDPRIDSGDIAHKQIIAQMTRCRDSDMPLLMAPPDSIFGDGSIEHICAVGVMPDICVAVPHVRCTPKILGESGFADTNDRLVRLAFKYLHRSWQDSDATKKMTNSFGGGVSWRKIGEGMYAVTHRLPTVYLANLLDTDLQWWHAQTICDSWDHRWPSKLCAESRHRVIGSSDAAFIAELTPEFGSIPHVAPANPYVPDDYYGQAAHHIFNRNVVAIFRAEPIREAAE